MCESIHIFSYHTPALTVFGYWSRVNTIKIRRIAAGCRMYIFVDGFSQTPNPYEKNRPTYSVKTVYVMTIESIARGRRLLYIYIVSNSMFPSRRNVNTKFELCFKQIQHTFVNPFLFCFFCFDQSIFDIHISIYRLENCPDAVLKHKTRACGSSQPRPKYIYRHNNNNQKQYITLLEPRETIEIADGRVLVGNI